MKEKNEILKTNIQLQFEKLKSIIFKKTFLSQLRRNELIVQLKEKEESKTLKKHNIVSLRRILKSFTTLIPTNSTNPTSTTTPTTPTTPTTLLLTLHIYKSSAFPHLLLGKF